MTGVSVAFGFDFGTSKSAISWARADSINPIVIDISLDGQADRIDTCLLYDKTKGRSFIGTKAHEQFRLSLLNGNAERMEFFANFKPHIGESARDREAALRFLKEIRRSEGLVRELEHIPLKDAVFVVGCPVSWIGDGASELIDLLKDAGFPPSFAIPEPVGAAFYFLGSKLRAQAFHKDIVVCDWGAGTFDMTVLRSSRLSYENSESWGSKLYGGRLFDDLFYQWVLETAAQRGHGNAVRRLAALPIEQEIFHASKARKIKEDFSRFFARDEKPQSWIWESPVVIGVGSDRIDLGDFVVDRISDFELRMRNYSASKLAKRWIDLAEYDAESAEADYVEALKTGKPVDLRAWGAALFEAGLQKLAVGEGATIILTGGSSNWRWFSDHVNSKWPFAGRPSSVIFDSKPELTIARGLARVYAVGSYSGRLAQEIEAARSELSAPLRAIHAELLEKLADKLTIIMRSDRKLQAELEAIFKSWIAGDSQRGQYSSSGERLKAIFQNLVKDKSVEEIRPRLERCIGDWLAENQGEIKKTSEMFSREAYIRIMDLLKSQIRTEIGGLVEVAIEACGATGATSLGEALRGLGAGAKFEPNVLLKLYSAMASAVSDAYNAVAKRDSALQADDAMKQQAEIAAKAERALQKFYQFLPDTIEKNILAVQNSHAWATQVTGHMLMTLRTLERLARIDHARGLAPARELR